MAKRIKIAKTKERKLNIPGFSADASLGPMVSSYRGGTVFSGSASDGRGTHAATWSWVTVGRGFGRLPAMQGQWRRRSRMSVLRRPSTVHDRRPSLLTPEGEGGATRLLRLTDLNSSRAKIKVGLGGIVQMQLTDGGSR